MACDYGTRLSAFYARTCASVERNSALPSESLLHCSRPRQQHKLLAERRQHWRSRFGRRQLGRPVCDQRHHRAGPRGALRCWVARSCLCAHPPACVSFEQLWRARVPARPLGMRCWAGATSRVRRRACRRTFMSRLPSWCLPSWCLLQVHHALGIVHTNTWWVMPAATGHRAPCLLLCCCGRLLTRSPAHVDCCTALPALQADVHDPGHEN